MKRLFSPRVIIPFAVMMLMISFYSCSENPVTPPSEEPFELDSARFEWDIDTIPGFGIGENCIYAEDTNNIFLVNTFENYLLNIRDGQKLFYYFNDFYPKCINGRDNEVYIGGMIRNNSGKFIAHIKKWNNGSFQDIYIPEYDTSNGDVVKYLYISQSSEVWVMTIFYFMRYSKNQFSVYQIPYEDPDWLREVKIFEDYSNSLKAYAHHLGGQKTEYSFIFEFVNNRWEKIWQNTWYPDNKNLLFMSIINNNIISNYSNKIYEFDGVKFNNVLTVNINHLEIIYYLIGNTLDDFLFMGNLNNTLGEIFMHWNGNKLSLEIPINISTSWFPQVYKINSNSFLIVLNFFDNKILIFKGTK